MICLGGGYSGAREAVFFFYQAEDGIRDDLVTGVQTCALPICGCVLSRQVRGFSFAAAVATSCSTFSGGYRAANDTFGSAHCSSGSAPEFLSPRNRPY